MKLNYVVVISTFLLFSVGVNGQVYKFNREVKDIAVKLQNETLKEKEDLKVKIDSLTVLEETNKLSKDQVQDLKNSFAEASSMRLENIINNLNDSISIAVQNHVEYSIKSGDLYDVEEDMYGTSINIGRRNYIQNGKKIKGDKRNQFQVLFAYGMSNLATEGAFANSELRYIPSNFIQWGFTINTRLLKDHNLLHLRYGVALEYNNLKSTGHRYFSELDNGDVVLIPHEKELRKSRLAIRSIQIPVYLEFDLSKNIVDEKTGRVHFKSHQTWRFGVGGFVNFNKRTPAQVYRYTDDGSEYRVRENSDLTINKVRYGLGAYIGNGDWSLFTQYELTPLFKDSGTKQNMWSLGLRLDI